MKFVSLESYPVPLVTVICPEVTLILLCSYTCVPLFVCSAYLIWYHHLRDEAGRDPYGQKRKQTLQEEYSDHEMARWIMVLMTNHDNLTYVRAPQAER